LKEAGVTWVSPAEMPVDQSYPGQFNAIIWEFKGQNLGSKA